MLKKIPYLIICTAMRLIDAPRACHGALEYEIHFFRDLRRLHSLKSERQHGGAQQSHEPPMMVPNRDGYFMAPSLKQVTL